MGSSKKHKEKKKHHKKKSRSRSKEREHKKHSHKSSRHKEKTRKRSFDEYEDHHHDSYQESSRNSKKYKDETEARKYKEEPDAKRIKREPSSDEDGPHVQSGKSSESLSIEETNKLRAKLGLKPLKEDGQDGEKGSNDKEEGTSSFDKPEVFVQTPNMAQEEYFKALREKVALQRQKRKITAKLKEVVPLANQVDDDEDAAKWVERNRLMQKEKEEAERRAKQLETMEQEFGIGDIVAEEFKLPSTTKQKNYTSKDLANLTIGHSKELFQEGQSVILTLKDQDVLADGEDILENVNIVDNLKAAKNVENKKLKPGYIPYEEPEFDEFGILKKKSILSKYDEEIEGEKKESFKLGAVNEDKERELEIIRSKLRQQQQAGVVSLQMPDMKPLSEYYTHDEMVQFKKVKKKVRKVRKRGLKPEELAPLPSKTNQNRSDHGSRRKHEGGSSSKEDSTQNGEIQNDIAMDVDTTLDEEPDIIGPEIDLMGIVVDEDKAEQELQKTLEKARKLKQQMEAKEAALALKETLDSSPKESYLDDNMGPSLASGELSLVLNTTKEFCRKLGDIPTYGLSGNRDLDELQGTQMEEGIDDDEDEEMSKDPEAESSGRGTWNEVDIDTTRVEIKEHELQPILEEEPDVSVGIAGALKLATKKGYLEKETSKPVGVSRLSHLQAKSYSIEEKFYDDDKFGSGKRDRYQSGPISEFREKDTYKPDVKLEYIDDSGRVLTAKEAFRYLSHKFHGKGPGKNKVDKRMKKLEQDAKLKQMSSTDTPLSTVKLLQEKQKELHAPYILLSGGSKALTQSTMISKTK